MAKARFPTSPQAYVTREKATRPVKDFDTRAEMAKRRVEGTKVEQQYGFEYLRRKKVIRPYDYVPDLGPGAAPGPFIVPANATQTLIVTINKEAYFELTKIGCIVDVPLLGILGGRGDDFTYRFKDDRKQLWLSNNPIHSICGTGSGIFPLVLPDSKLFSPSTTFSVEIANRRAVAINTWWLFRGRNYYIREFENLTDVPDFERMSQQMKQFFLAKQKKYIEPYFFTMDTSPVAVLAGATLNDQPINIRQEGDFELFAYTAFEANGRPFTFHVRESNTGRFIMNREVHAQLGAGDGERPALLEEPLWIDANSQLLITFRNLDAANAATIFLCLIGRKWFDVPSMNLTAGPDFYFSKYEAIR